VIYRGLEWWIDTLKISLHRIIEANVSKHILGFVFETLFPVLPTELESSDYSTQGNSAGLVGSCLAVHKSFLSGFW
jgi:hypothetical protein